MKTTSSKHVSTLTSVQGWKLHVILHSDSSVLYVRKWTKALSTITNKVEVAPYSLTYLLLTYIITVDEYKCTRWSQ